MAQTLNPETGAAPEEESAADPYQKYHNATEVDQVLEPAFDYLRMLDKQLDEARAQYIKPILDKQKKEWRRLKTDTNISIKRLRRRYEIENDIEHAENIENPDERMAAMVEIRSCFGGLVETGKLNWVVSYGAPEEPAEAPGDEPEQEPAAAE